LWFPDASSVRGQGSCNQIAFWYIRPARKPDSCHLKLAIHAILKVFTLRVYAVHDLLIHNYAEHLFFY